MISILPVVPQEGSKYLLDTNIWIKVLDQPFDLYKDLSNFSESKRERYLQHRAYLNFFDSLVILGKPAIIMSSMSINEIINAYLRVIGFRSFIKRNGNNWNLEYKKNYRPSKQFAQDFGRIRRALNRYSKNCILIPDDFGNAHTIETMLDYTPSKMDCADHYYYRLTQLSQYTLVTDDGDFEMCKDISILTLNKGLLKSGGQTAQ